jgi:predicted N-formylglutamate amidohydrolase
MYTLILSCEHASNSVPEQLQATFEHRTQLLRSHRAYDQGALDAAERIAKVTGAPLICGKCTRLAVDLNRSDKNPKRFSQYSRKLDAANRKLLEKQWHQPHRDSILNGITRIIQSNTSALHLSIHSFTPILDGVRRDTDIGLLYDPSRKRERAFASDLKSEVSRIIPNLKVRFNYPYRGVSDGITSWLRKQFTETKYTGLEIEFNQKLLKNSTEWNKCIGAFIAALEKVKGMKSAIFE